MPLQPVRIYDTTLRDGSQGEGVSFSVNDKLRIAARLDHMGFAYIEGGWPGSNPKDAEFFAAARKQTWTHARITAFGSTCRPFLGEKLCRRLRGIWSTYLFSREI